MQKRGTITTKMKSEICALLGNYAAYSGNSSPTFQDNLSVPSSRVKNLLGFSTLEDGTNSLSRNIGKEL
jgi:hypothetical protein